MRRRAAPLLLALALLGAASVAAQTLRWGSRGDTQSMDPHAFLEAVTANVNTLVYDALVDFDRQLQPVPGLASRWTVEAGTRWRFELRRGVLFHDGTPLTADDVVFSIERAQQPTSQMAVFARPLGRAVQIDEHTVELQLARPNPTLLQQLALVSVMSRAWCTAHRAERVPDFQAKEEGFSSFNTMGTGRFMLRQREPGVRTVFVRNPRWWGRFEGNVQEVVFLPIASAATRTAALLGGDIDLLQDVPLQDLERLSNEPKLRVWSGPENRIVFFGLDQASPALPQGEAGSRNPFKDVRVREAVFRAIDSAALASAVMRGQAQPTACLATSAGGCHASELDTPPLADLPRARRLLAEAGYAGGFKVTLDCPNDRFVSDAALCLAIAAQLARVGIGVEVQARPRGLHFRKIQNGGSSFYMHGWGGSNTDPQFLLDTTLHSFDAASQKGGDNYGGHADAELDRLIDAAGAEMVESRRKMLIRDAQRLDFHRFYYLPLHRQVLHWATRANVQPVVTPNNMVRADWVRID
jgi:peptide/nickel transport system substrate-binding protein